MLFSPVATLNDSAVCRQGRGEPPFDALGFSRHTWHRLVLEAGMARSAFDGGNPIDETTLELGAEIVTHRRYRRPGEGRSPVGPGQWSAFSTSNLLGDRRLRGTWFNARTVLYGRYFRRYAEVPEGLRSEPDGWGAMFGIGSTFDYDARDLPLGWDRTVSAGLAGPMLDLAARRGSLAIRAQFTAQYSFSIVQSLAYPEAAPSFANDFIKSELRQQGYYYAQGLTTGSAVTVDAGGFELYLRARTGSFWSINRDDRYQGKIDNNFALADTRVFLRAAAAVRPFGGPVRFALELDETYRGQPPARLRLHEHREARRPLGVRGVLELEPEPSGQVPGVEPRGPAADIGRGRVEQRVVEREAVRPADVDQELLRQAGRKTDSRRYGPDVVPTADAGQVRIAVGHLVVGEPAAAEDVGLDAPRGEVHAQRPLGAVAEQHRAAARARAR